MADLIAALCAMQAADAPVTAIAGPRIFGGELPDGETPHMPRHALVIAPSGGASLTSGSYAPVDTQRVDLIAYGPTPAEANRLLRSAARVFLRARRQLRAGALIHWVGSAGGFSAARDPDAAWPRAFQSFQVFYAYMEV